MDREDQYLFSLYSPFHTRFSSKKHCFQVVFQVVSPLVPIWGSPKYRPTVPTEYRGELGLEVSMGSLSLALPLEAARGRWALCFPFWPGSGPEACRAHALGQFAAQPVSRRVPCSLTCTEVGRVRLPGEGSWRTTVPG